MNILITGGAGFIGSHVVETLQAEHDLVVIDDLNNYYDPQYKLANLKLYPNVPFYQIDICNKNKLETVFKEHQFDCIVHLAARAGIRPSLLQPKLYEDVNVVGTKNLAELAVRYGISQLVFGSSSSVYGDNPNRPYVETDTTGQPISPYATTKLTAEQLLKQFADKEKLKVTCLRFFTVYGERGRPDMAPYLFTEAILKHQPIKKFGDGSSSRDYTYVNDIVQGIVAAIKNPFNYELINLGNNKSVTLNEFIETIAQLSGEQAIIEQAPEQTGDVKHTCANISKAQKLLNYQPQTSFTEGMQNFITWFRKYRL
ncbi:MAG: NAD-dependent epimerase/dehydratase family protein [Patescibacteria group bacterium]|jgi:UDP-glucuronate 4-epimerase